MQMNTKYINPILTYVILEWNGLKNAIQTDLTKQSMTFCLIALLLRHCYRCGVVGSNPGPVKSNTVWPSLRCFFGAVLTSAKPHRWIPPLFGVIMRV